MLGDSVRWTMRLLPRTPGLQGLGFQAALLAACASSPERLWAFYRTLDHDADWTSETLEDAADLITREDDRAKDCVLARTEAENRVWNDVFYAAARGVRVSPTLMVGTVQIEGVLTTEALLALIRTELREQPL